MWWLEAVTGTPGNAVLLRKRSVPFPTPSRAAVASGAGPTGLTGREPGHAPVSQGPVVGPQWWKGTTGNDCPGACPSEAGGRGPAFASNWRLPPAASSPAAELINPGLHPSH